MSKSAARADRILRTPETELVGRERRGIEIRRWMMVLRLT